MRVALGLDEAGINDDRDMLQEMRLVLRLHREPGMDEVCQPPPGLTDGDRIWRPDNGFARHRHPGARQGGRSGTDALAHLAYPYLDRRLAIDAVVHRGKVSGVETVLVAGAPVLRDGQFVRVAKAEVLEELATSLRLPLSPEEEHRRQLARDIFPYVQRFYDGSLDEQAREPFYRTSARY